MTPSTYAARIAEGVCRLCGADPVPGMAHCDYHLEQVAAASAHKRAKRRAEGKCPICGRALEGGYKTCSVCRERQERNRARRKAEQSNEFNPKWEVA